MIVTKWGLLAGPVVSVSVAAWQGLLVAAVVIVLLAAVIVACDVVAALWRFIYGDPGPYRRDRLRGQLG